MKTPLRFLSVAVVCLTAMSAAQAQDALTLRYGFQKDKEYVYQKSHTVKQSQSLANDQKIETEMSTTDVSVWTLKEKDKKGNLHIQTESKAFKAKVKIGPLGDYTFDSKKNDNDTAGQLGAALTPVYERMSSAMLTVVMSPRGEIAEVKGYKELMGDLLKDNPLGQQLLAGGSEKAAKLSYAEFHPILSEKPIRAGDTWEVPYELELPKFGKAKGKKVYTFQGMDKVGKRKTARITMTSELSFDLDLDQDGAKVTGNLSITNSSGTIHFDPKNGHVVSMKNEYTIGGNLNVAVGGQNIGVTTEQTQNTTLELLDKLPE